MSRCYYRAWVDRSMLDEESLVHWPARAGRLKRRAVVWTVVYLACACYVGAFLGGPWFVDVPVSMLVGWACGRAGFRALATAQSFHLGWISGRTDAMTSLLEAQRRGMSGPEWAQSVFEKDWPTR